MVRKAAPARTGPRFTARSAVILVTGMALAFLFYRLLSRGGMDTERFRLVALEACGETPVLLVESAPLGAGMETGDSYFSLFKPLSAECSAWTPLAEQLSGPAFGLFPWEDEKGPAVGVFHAGRATFFRPTENGVETEFRMLPRKWTPETGAMLGNKLYVFGGEFSDEEIDQARAGKTMRGTLRVAAYDGQEFKELELPDAPELITGAHGAFWLQCVYHEGKLLLFWRPAEWVVFSDLDPPSTLTGSLAMAEFDGQRFEPEVRRFENLPRGYTTVWSSGSGLRLAIQPQMREFGKSTSPRIYALPEGGEAIETSIPERDEPLRLSFKFYTLNRVPGTGEDIFLRSNSQVFQVWTAGSDGWSVIERPVGLPVRGLERMLLFLLCASVGVVALGLGIALRRRRQVMHLVQKLQPQDVLAPLSLRISAHLIDLALVTVASEIAAYLIDVPNAGILHNIIPWDLSQPYFFIYVFYLALAEWAGGATLGKLMMGLRVVNDKGVRISVWSALVRNLIGYFERNPVFATFLAMPTILFTPSRQRLGDLLGHTLVVQKAAMERFKAQRQQETEQKLRQAEAGLAERIEEAKSEGGKSESQPAPSGVSREASEQDKEAGAPPSQEKAD